MNLTATADSSDKSTFSAKAFLIGLAVVLLIYTMAAIVVSLSPATSKKAITDRLASQTVIVEWDKETQKLVEPAEPYGPPQEVDMAIIEYNAPEYLESGLAEAPVDGLYEKTSFGNKPIIRYKDGLTPFMAYRRPFDIHTVNKNIISIVIAELGLSDVATESAVRTMPPDISFIMSPYATAMDFWVNEARSRGHEVWLSLPVEPENYPEDDPGPHTMLIDAPERENITKLEWLMTRATGYAGFVTGPKPAFIKATNDMRPIIGAIYGSGLSFIDGDTNPNLIPQTMAVGAKAPYGNVDVWLDLQDASRTAIFAKLKELEKIASQKGYAVGVIQPLPVSYQQLLKWIPTLEQKNLALAPLSAATGH